MLFCRWFAFIQWVKNNRIRRSMKKWIGSGWFQWLCVWVFSCWGYTVEAWSWEALKFWRVRDLIRRFINFIIASIEFLALNTCDSHRQGKHRTLPTIPFAGRLAAKQFVGVGDHIGVSIFNLSYPQCVALQYMKTYLNRRALKTLVPTLRFNTFHISWILLRELVARRLSDDFLFLPIIRRNHSFPKRINSTWCAKKK